MDIFFLDKLIFGIIKGFFCSGAVIEGLPIGSFLKLSGTGLVGAELISIVLKKRVENK